MQETENRLVLDLVTDMASVVCFVFDVEQFATVHQLKEVVEEIKFPIEETANLVAKRDARPLICVCCVFVCRRA
jgi:hypothetical protein